MAFRRTETMWGRWTMPVASWIDRGGLLGQLIAVGVK